MRKNTKAQPARQAEWLRISTAARVYGVHYSTVYRWVGDKRVRSMRHGGYRPCLLVSASDMRDMTGSAG